MKSLLLFALSAPVMVMLFAAVPLAFTVQIEQRAEFQVVQEVAARSVDRGGNGPRGHQSEQCFFGC
jgi:hypothetical protein